MANVLSETKREQVVALGRLSWSLRRIEAETGVRRETASRYLQAAGVGVRGPGWRRAVRPAGEAGARASPAEAAIEMSPDALQGKSAEPEALGEAEGAEATGTSRPSLSRRSAQSACEGHREFIAAALGRGRCAKLIWQDLVDAHGFKHSYASVMRFARTLRPKRGEGEARAVIDTPPGQEAQVDYAGDGPLVRDAVTGRYRRARLFCMTLGWSRKSVRLVALRSSATVWAELHERAFRMLGAVPQLVVLDNLREGVLTPDMYDPTLNPVYRAMLTHYGVAALPCRVRNPDRKGKVEADVKSAQRAHRGLTFESLGEAQTYYDQRAERWDDTRIHGTTKQQVAARFAEELAAMRPLPLEPFRYFRYGERTVHPDGHVEIEAAYYSAPPGMIHQRLHVQWDDEYVRILTKHGVLLREHRRSEQRGRHTTAHEDRARRTPGSTRDLLTAATTAGPHIGKLCHAIHQRDGEAGVRRILGVLALAKRLGGPRTEEAASAALTCGAPSYRFVKNWLDRTPSPALSLKQTDALIRPLTEYRDLIERMSRSSTEGEPR